MMIVELDHLIGEFGLAPDLASSQVLSGFNFSVLRTLVYEKRWSCFFFGGGGLGEIHTEEVVWSLVGVEDYAVDIDLWFCGRNTEKECLAGCDGVVESLVACQVGGVLAEMILGLSGMLGSSSLTLHRRVVFIIAILGQRLGTEM